VIMMKKGFVVTAIFVASTFIQLISQIVITRIYGASLVLDTFLAAVAIPSIVVTVIYGTLNNVLIPILGEKQTKDPKRYESYFISLLFTLGILSLVVSIIVALFSYPLSNLLYPGKDSQFINTVSRQMSVLFFSIPFAVIATILGAYYYVKKHFYQFPVAQLFGSISNLCIIIVLYSIAGIWALITGFIINLIFQIVFVLPKQVSLGHFKFINVKIILFAWIPLIVGQFMLRSDTIIIRSYASYLPTGYIVYLNLISKIFSIATSVMTIGIQVLLLPHLVEYFAKQQHQKAIRAVNKAKIISIGMSIVVALSVALVGPFTINLLFKGGKFTSEDVRISSSLIPIFILPAIGWGISGVFFQPLLALKKYVAVGVISTLSFVLALLASFATNQFYGPLQAISVGLIVLLFTGIIGGEIIWQQNKKNLI